MTWFRVDDAFPECDKVQELEDDPELWAAAIALWTIAGCKSSAGSTDGFIRERRIGRFTPLPDKMEHRAAQALVECGLWDRVEGGYRFHDWSDYNPTKKELAESRKLKAERQAKWRESKRLGRSGGAPQDAPVDDCVDGLQDAPPKCLGDTPPDESQDAAPPPPNPTRPVPSHPPPTVEDRARAPEPPPPPPDALPAPATADFDDLGIDPRTKAMAAELERHTKTLPSSITGAALHCAESLLSVAPMHAKAEWLVLNIRTAVADLPPNVTDQAARTKLRRFVQRTDRDPRAKSGPRHAAADDGPTYPDLKPDRPPPPATDVWRAAQDAIARIGGGGA